MASSGKGNEPEWIERIKAEGSVSFLEPDNCRNGWSIPHGSKFMVRGPEYMSNKVKVPGGDFLLKPLGFDWIKGSAKIGEVFNHPNNRVRNAIYDEFPTDDKPFVWAFNIQVPGKDNYSAVAYFVAMDPIPEGSLMDQFLKGDDEFRNSRLKLIANIVKGPWIVRKAVGEQAICLIGRALACKYCVTENFLEVDLDIGSSMVASAIVHLAFGYITTLTVDLAFVIEGRTESELPERLLGAIRFSELNPTSTSPIPLPSAWNVGVTPRTGLWKSIGQGFSQLLHSGAKESNSLSGSSHVNGILDRKSSYSSSGSTHGNGIVDHKDNDSSIGSTQVNEIVDHENSDSDNGISSKLFPCHCRSLLQLFQNFLSHMSSTSHARQSTLQPVV